jgi:hypothetical protein
MPQVYGKVTQNLPLVSGEGTQAQPRLTRLGELVVTPIGSGTYQSAAEGTYFKAVNPTFGTAFAPSVAAATAFSETQASIIVRNTAGGNGKDIYLDYIRIWYATAGAGQTTLEAVAQIDNANRTGSGGSSATIINVNSNATNTSVASVTVGPIASATAVSSRKLGVWRLKSAITAVGDEYFFSFGQTSPTTMAPGVVKVAQPGPVYLPGGSNHSFLLHLYGAAQSAAGTIHLDMGWWER